jgi:polyphosphate kinase
LRDLLKITDLDLPKLNFPPFRSRTVASLREVDAEEPDLFFAAIRPGEILLHHPYESFTSSVVQFLQHAAQDPSVLAIKQTLYRTSGDSPIIEALIEAAEAGKQVLAVIELRARFDEQANVRWARKLEAAGVHVVYGLMGLKTHAKISLVVRDEAQGLRLYCHMGTGNYNPKTARFYEDYGLLTSRDEVGEDIAKLFNRLSAYAEDLSFNEVMVSPVGVRTGLTALIEAEAKNVKEGKPAGIQIKLNSLVDEQIIDSLYRASKAGVKVEILVRGMCSLKPGVAGLSENITVRSILGRYLEHSRVFRFVNGGTPLVFIGSADMMHRNLDRRVETLVRLRQEDHLSQIQRLFELAMHPQASSWNLNADGTWLRNGPVSEDTELFDLQDQIMSRTLTLRPGAI